MERQCTLRIGVYTSLKSIEILSIVSVVPNNCPRASRASSDTSVRVQYSPIQICPHLLKTSRCYHNFSFVCPHKPCHIVPCSCFSERAFGSCSFFGTPFCFAAAFPAFFIHFPFVSLHLTSLQGSTVAWERRAIAKRIDQQMMSKTKIDGRDNFPIWQSCSCETSSAAEGKTALPTMNIPWRARVNATLIRFSTSSRTCHLSGYQKL